MRTVIYNPNDIDAILTAAILQTGGWVTYSRDDIVDETEGTFIWLGLIPSRKHFRATLSEPKKFKETILGWANRIKRIFVKPKDREFTGNPTNNQSKKSAKVQHVAILHGGQIPQSHPSVVQDVEFVDQFLSNTRRDIQLSTTSPSTILSKACAMLRIQSNELAILNYFIEQFKNPVSPIEVRAYTIRNVKAAIECLEKRELFTPILLPAKTDTELDGEWLEIIGDYYKEVAKAKRVLAHKADYKTVTTSVGRQRVILTYETENWWHVRQFFSETDIGYNIVNSVTGVHVNATLKFEFDLGLKDHITVIS